MLPGVPPTTLAQRRIFFYSHTYTMPASDHSYGKINVVDMPPLLSMEWPHLDVWSILSMKEKLVSDILSHVEVWEGS